MFFHEDDYCQVQLLPFENALRLRDEAELVSGFAASHFDGTTYSQMYVRGDEQFLLSRRNILPAEIDRLLERASLRRVEKVLSGYGQSFREELRNTVGYGEESACLLYDFENGVVQHVWLIYRYADDESLKEKLKTALYYLGYRWNLVLMDWNELRLVDPQRKAALEKYLNGEGMNLHS